MGCGRLSVTPPLKSQKGFIMRQERPANPYFLNNLGLIVQNNTIEFYPSFGSINDEHSIILHIVLEEIVKQCTHHGLLLDTVKFIDNDYKTTNRALAFNESSYRNQDNTNSNSDRLINDNIFCKFPSYGQMNYVHTYSLIPDYITNKETKTEFKIFGKVIFNQVFQNIRYMDSYGWGYHTPPFAVFTVGREKLVLAVIGIDGVISIVRPTIDMMIYDKIYTDDIFTVIGDIIKFQVEQSKQFFKDFDVNNISTQLLSAAISKLISHGYNKPEIKEISNVFSSIIKNFLEVDEISSTILLNRSNIYRSKMLSFIEKEKDVKVHAFREGMNAGLKLFTPMYLAGYTYNQGNNQWEKEVNIVPKYCMKHYKTWEFLPGKHNYYIKKLYLPMDQFIQSFGGSFSIKAEGHHPNVSGSNVCIGELSQEWVDIMNVRHQDFRNIGDLNEKIKVFLLKIETTLEIPNFDSSFEQLSDFNNCVVEGSILVGNTTKSNTGKHSFTYLD